MSQRNNELTPILEFGTKIVEQIQSLNEKVEFIFDRSPMREYHPEDIQKQEKLTEAAAGFYDLEYKRCQYTFEIQEFLDPSLRSASVDIPKEYSEKLQKFNENFQLKLAALTMKFETSETQDQKTHPEHMYIHKKPRVIHSLTHSCIITLKSIL